MSEETDEGAIATVKYFINAVNLAYQTNDETLFANLQTNDCASCNSIGDTIRSARESKENFEHYSLDLGELYKVGPMDQKGWFGVEFEVIERAYGLYDSAEFKSQKKAESKSTDTVFVLTFQSGTWLVRAFSA